MAEETATRVGVISLDLIIAANIKAQMERLSREADAQAKQSFSRVGQAVNDTVSRSTRAAAEAIAQPFDALKQRAAQTQSDLDEIIARSMSRVNAPLRSSIHGDEPRIVPRVKTTLATDPEAALRALDEPAEKAKELRSELEQSVEAAKKLPGAGANAAQALEGVRAKAAGTRTELSRAGAGGPNMGQAMQKTVQGALEGTKKRTLGVFEALGAAAKKLGKTIAGVFKAVFVTAAFYAAFRGLKSMLEQGAAGSEEFSKSLNAVKANLTAAFQPILQAVMPVLNTLMSALAAATKQVAAFISALFGKTYQQSVEAANKLQGVQSKAEKAKGALAGFDELTVIGPQGGAGAGGIDYGALDTYGTEQAEALAQKVKQIFAQIKQGAQEAGRYFMEKLGGNKAFATLAQSARQFRTDLTATFENLKTVGDVAFGALRRSAQENLVHIEAGISGLVAGAANGVAIVTRVVGGIANAASTGIKNFVLEHESVISGLIDRTTDNLARCFANLGTAFQKITGVVGGAVSAFFEQNSSYISEWSGTISTAFWNVAQPLIDFFSGAWLDISTAVSEFASDPALENFLAAVNDSLVAMQPVWEWFNELVRKLWDNIGGGLNVALEGLRGQLNGLWQFIKDYILNVLETWTTALHGIAALLRGDWKTAWEEGKNFAKSAIEGIIETFKNFVNIFIEGVNGIIRGLNKLSMDVPGGGSIGVHIPEIPRFASGGVITQPTLGLIGEYPGAGGNPEIISPRSMMYDTMVEANAPLVVALAEKLDEVIAAVGRITTVVELDGEKISKNTVARINDETRRTGESPLWA